MYRANADVPGPYTIHLESCLRVKHRIWWHGLYDTLLEAYLPVVKHQMQISLCRICRPMPKPEEKEHLRKLVNVFGAATPDADSG